VVVRISRVQKVTLFWVIGTALTVVSSAIGLTWKASAWVASLETQLKGHDDKFTDIQQRMGKLEDASRDTAKDLGAIQATLNVMSTDRRNTNPSFPTTENLDASATLLAERIAEIGKNLNNIANTMRDGLPIKLTQVPPVTIEQKSSGQSNATKDNKGPNGTQPPPQAPPAPAEHNTAGFQSAGQNDKEAKGTQPPIQSDEPLKEAAAELIKIENKLLDPDYKISRHSREELLLKVMSQLEQVEALRAHAPLNPQ
jgi:hypothetical protein